MQQYGSYLLTNNDFGTYWGTEFSHFSVLGANSRLYTSFVGSKYKLLHSLHRYARLHWWADIVGRSKRIQNFYTS